MGFCKNYVKPAIKELREEVTRAVWKGAIQTATHFTEAISDGKLTKDEAGKLGEDALKVVFGITTGAARTVLALAVRAVNNYGAKPDEAEDADDDQAEADIEVILGT